MATRWITSTPLLYAHQGGAKEAPSSTVFACREALAAGANALELDVHRSADGHLVVCHDRTVDRTTDASGDIASLTLAELQLLDNAYWWIPGELAIRGRDERSYPHRGRAATDPAFRISTLEQILIEFPSTVLNLDIKRRGTNGNGYEREIADLLRRHGRTNDVIVASFHNESLAAFREYAPDIATSMGPRDVTRLLAALVPGVRPRIRFHPSIVAAQLPIHARQIPLVTKRLVDVAHHHGLAVHVWTIDDPAEMHRLLGLGVDGIMTDRPSVLSCVVRGRFDEAG